MGLLLPFLIAAWGISSVHVRTISRVLPQCALPTRAPLAMSELQPGLEMTFLRPASQRTWPPKVCCLHGATVPFADLCSRAHPVRMPVSPHHQLLITYTQLHSGRLLPACLVTTSELCCGEKSRNLLPNGLIPSLGGVGLANFGLPWMLSVNSTVTCSVSLYFIVICLSELQILYIESPPPPDISVS